MFKSAPNIISINKDLINVRINVQKNINIILIQNNFQCSAHKAVCNLKINHINLYKMNFVLKNVQILYGIVIKMNKIKCV